MKKSFFAAMMALVLVMSTFVGCSSPSSSAVQQPEAGASSGTAGTPDNGAGKTELVFWMRGSAEDALSKAIEADIAAYNASADGLATISIEYVPITDFATKFNTAFAGGTAPDIMDTGVDQIAVRAHMGQYAALDDYLAGWSGTDEMVEACLKAGYMLDDGKTYGIAYSPHPAVFVWRKDFFAEAGLDPETPPADWDEMLEYAKKLVVKDGNTVTRGGFSIEPGNHRMFTIMARQAGCTLYDSDSMPTINDAGGVATLQYFEEIAPYSIIWSPAPGANVPFPFITSEAAMAYVSLEELTDMIKNNPDLADAIGVAAYVPKAGGPASTWCGYRLFSINADSAHKDEAWDAVQFLMSPERVEARMNAAGTTPVYESMQADFVALNPDINEAALGAIAIGEPFPKTDWAQTFGEVVNNAVQEVLYSVKDPQTALDDAVASIIADMNI